MGPQKNNSNQPDTDKADDDASDKPVDKFAVGKHCWCIYTGDNSWRDCEIIEKKPLSSDATKFKYYVHYIDFNRRMDIWVDQDQISDVNPDNPEAELQVNIVSHMGPPASKKQRGVVEFVEEEYGENAGMDEASIREHEEVTKVKNVNNIILGRNVVPTWYFSPIPKELYPEGSADKLYCSEYTLDFFRHEREIQRHYRKCTVKHPPGDEIYRDEESKLSFFEVDGAKSKMYAQNLCYLAKFFLDHKTLHYDVDPFLFYVLCEFDDRGYHIVGYFSKEKYSEQGFNLACILCLPPYQRKGYGRYLISFSYELSKKENKVGSPEKPLSDLGQISYRSYWSGALLDVLKDYSGKSISVMDLTKITSIKTEDVIQTLTHLGLLQYVNGKYVLFSTPEKVDALLKTVRKRGTNVKPEYLHWAPLKVDVKRDKWSIKSKKKMDSSGQADLPPIAGGG